MRFGRLANPWECVGHDPFGVGRPPPVFAALRHACRAPSPGPSPGGIPTADETDARRGPSALPSAGSGPTGGTVERGAAFDAAEVVRRYDHTRLRLGMIASHSALDLCDGATDEGFRTVAVCEKGREKTYERYRRIVHEVIVLDRFAEVTRPEVLEKLTSRCVIFTPNRSLTAYVPVECVENDLRVPMFGNRRILKTDERDLQYEMFQRGGIPCPRKIDSPQKIDGPAIVKVPDARKPVERAFFTCSSVQDFHAKVERRVEQGLLRREDVAKAWIEEYVVGALFNFNFFYSPLNDRLEFLGLDRRIQTNIDGFLKLPARDQLDLPIETKNEEVGHESVTIRESLLEGVFELGERLVEVARKMYPPGIIGPFALQGSVKPHKEIVIFDFSPRMPGSPVLYSSPYSKYFFGKAVTSGRRVAMEIKEAAEQNRLAEVVS